MRRRRHCRGLIETFEVHQQCTGRAMPLEGLKRLATKFEVGMPVFETDTRAARQEMAALRREAHLLRVDYAGELVQVTQIATELEKVLEAA